MAGKSKFVAILLVFVLFAGCSATKDPVRVYNRGVVEYNNGNYAKAVGMFKLALESYREYSLPMIGLARCYLHFAKENLDQANESATIKDLEESLYWINQAIDADPGNTQAAQTKADILQLQEKVKG